MKQILGYHILDVIEDSRFKKVLSVRKSEGEEKRAVTVLKMVAPAVSEKVRFQQVAAKIQGLSIPGIIKIFEIKPHEKSFAIITEDLRGIPFKAALSAMGPPRFKIFLKIALALTETLGRLHAENIIQNGLRPEHILINPDLSGAKLLPFGFISILSHEAEYIYSPEVIQRLLPYLAPEQTGRMNRPVDFRADFYALGVLFYEMLTQAPPFVSEDPVEIIHAHLARKPIPPVRLNPAIPAVLSDIVMKLIAKEPEDRYQSSFGLSTDLKTCLDYIEKGENIAAFAIAAQDITIRLGEPLRLFGREQEEAAIKHVLDEICEGQSATIFVSGPAGIGKSTLIQELQKPVMKKKGYFLHGKFDPFRRDAPYSAIIQVFQQLARQLASESRERIQALQENILHAIGPNVRVILDVIPEIGLILGGPLEIPRLNPEEAQNRFQMVMKAFTKLFASKSHPLVIFLDDLQWADPASLQLICYLLGDGSMPHFLFIGAYRDNHVHETGPLTATTARIRESGIRFIHIPLGPLQPDQVNEMIAAFLGCPKDAAGSLSNLVYSKTNGNPFFIHQFVQRLYREGLLTIDPTRGWRWDVDQIRQKQVTDNVIDLMISNISNLGVDVKEALTICACIGHRFELETVAAVLGRSAEETAQVLAEAVREGFIDRLQGSYSFQHDRIHEVAYGLISVQRKPGLHYRIGRVLLQRLSHDNTADALFQVVGQLNSGMSQITEEAEQEELARLNLQAGKNAKAAAAYEAALRHFSVAISLVGTAGWQKSYTHTLELFEEAAEAAYLSASYEKLERLSAEVIKQARSLLDAIKIYEVKIRTAMARNRLNEAIDTGLDVLQRMGVRFPEKPAFGHALLGLLHSQLVLRGRPIEQLVNLPRMKDPQALAVLRILGSISSAAYYSRPALLPLLVFKMVNLLVRYGNALGSSYQYAAYGLILCSIGRIETGYRFGRLALAILERTKAKEHFAKTNLVVCGFIGHWKDHAENGLPSLLSTYQAGLEIGDLEFAAHALMLYCWLAFQVREDLTGLTHDIEGHVETLKAMKQESQLQLAQICLQMIMNLVRTEEEPGRLSGAIYCEKQMLALHEDASDRTALCSLYFAKLFLNYLFGDYSQALANAERAWQVLGAIKGLFLYANFYFYDALIRLAFWETAAPQQRRSLLKRVLKNRNRLRRWARHAPMNFKHKHDLINAEIDRIRGKSKSAIENYRQAIEGAHLHEFLQEEALAYELAAKFHRSHGLQSLADIYMTTARDKYFQWGATAKALHLEKSYPDIFMRSLTPPQASLPSHMDYLTVVKALQAISTEIILENMLKQLLKIMVEIAGAGRVVFISIKADQLMIEAEREVSTGGDPDEEDGAVIQQRPLEQTRAVLLPAVNYVKRTSTALVVDDAGQHPLYSSDPYVQSNQPKSILCLPVIRQGNLTGILYLENNEASAVFTDDRVGILQLLSSQAAISLENALLYKNILEAEGKVQQLNAELEQRVAKRTAELQESLEVLKRTQRQLVQSEKMAALGGLVAGIAHEINTPLGIGVTAATFLKDKTENYVRKFAAGNLLEKDMQKYANYAMEASAIIHTNLNRAGELINSFKNVAVDQTHEERRTFRLKAYIGDILKSLRPKLKKTSHSIIINCPEELEINSYPGALSQIITNLVMNSLIHGFENIKAGEMRFDVWEEEAILVLKYSDNGCGMDEVTLSKIFDPFFTTKRNQGGTGLGMHILFNLVTQSLKGYIQVNSVLNQGTEFIIRIPITEDRPANC